MAEQFPNSFASPMITYAGELTALSLLTEGAYLPYIKAYPDMAGSYILAQEAVPGVLKWTGQKVWYRWEDQSKPLGAFRITGDVTGGAPGAVVTVTLTADSHLGNAGQLSPAAIGYIFQDNSTGIWYQVVDVDKTSDGAHTADLQPVDQNVTAELTAADSYLMDHGRNSAEEASEQMDGQYPAWAKVQRTLSALRADKRYSDLASFEVLDIMGQTYRKIDLPDLDRRFVDYQELKLMFKVPYDNIQAGIGLENSADAGLVPTVQALGNTITTGGAVTDAMFQDFKRVQSANGRTKTFDVLVDPEVTIAFQQYFESKTGVNGAVIYGDFSNGGDDVRLNFDFANQIKYYGVNLNLKEYEYFNKGRTHGAEPGTGVYAGSMLFIPQGEFVNGDNELQRLLTIKYMSDSPIGAVVHTFSDGGLVGKNTGAWAEFAHLTWKQVDVQRPFEFFYGNINV